MREAIHRAGTRAHRSPGGSRRLCPRRGIAAALGGLLVLGAAGAEAKRPPVPQLVLRSFAVEAGQGEQRVRRRVQFAAPVGWTPVSAPGASELELAGPDGEGSLLVFAGFHPRHLTPVLERLRRAHPSAAPSPPEAMELPGLRPELGERATRFVIEGQERGEMVMVERGGAIVLLVTVVAPEAWERVRSQMARVYPTVSVSE